MNKSTPKKSFTQRPKATTSIYNNNNLSPAFKNFNFNSQSLCVMLKERFLLKEVEIEDIAYIIVFSLTFNSTSFSTHVQNYLRLVWEMFY